jgi:hypothetical protein
MDEQVIGRRTRRRRNRIMVMTVRTIRALSVFFGKKFTEDVRVIWKHARLFFGLAFLAIGLLSFSSSKYCDGNASAHYACTRPTTYYYYSPWAIFLVLLGIFLITLWYLRSKKT